MQLERLESAFLKYIIDQDAKPGARLPTLAEMSADTGMSIGKLREQLEVARNMGVVSVRPRAGIQREPFNFLPAVRNSVLFGLATEEASFAQYSAVRRAIETRFWAEAVCLLLPEDKAELRAIIDRAWTKLRHEPVHIPGREHRQLHLTIFRRLNNPFVKGLLEAYWDAYDASELTRLAAYEYWLTVWEYHERIVTALCNNEYDHGLEILIEHFDLLPSVRVPPEMAARQAGSLPAP